jgi:hypothetical protein
MQLLRSAAALGLVAAFATACTDAPNVLAPKTASFIVNGQPTGNAYPSVGALLFDYDQNGVINGDDEFCTGSLISPTVFLTAGHCIVTPYTTASSQWYVSFAPDLYARSIKVIKATGVVVDPLYGHDQAHLHDLSVVFLPSGSTKGMTPFKLPTAGYLDQLKASGQIDSEVFLNVGYGTGATRTGKAEFPFDGVRKVSESEFMGLQPTWLGLLMNTSATGLGGDCYGDSGGPKLLKSNPTIVLATVTTGDANCRATTWDWRTDTPEARGFLGKYVQLP